MIGRTPTSALLERVEAHINRLDQALKESEDLLSSVRRLDREDWIQELHQRLVGEPTRGTIDQADVSQAHPSA